MKKLLLLGIVLLTIASVLAAAPPSTTFPKESTYYDKIEVGMQNVMLMSNPDIPFSEIGFTLDSEATRARLNVQSMPDCPENAPYQPRVLRCLLVTSQNFEDKNITASHINFKVPKNWISANNYDKSSIELRRYDYAWNLDGNLSEWERLQTVLVKEDNESLYYSAKTDGFDYFSIVAGKMLEQQTSQTILQPITIQQQVLEKIPGAGTYAYKLNPSTSAISIDPGSQKTILIIVLVIVAITLFGLRYSQHMTHPGPNPNEQRLEQILEKVRQLKSYPVSIIKAELRDQGWSDWMIDYALVKEKKFK